MTVKGHRPFVVRHHFELKLGVARPARTVDARIHQRPADPHPPVLLEDADPKTRPVGNLAPTAHCANSCASNDAPVDHGDEFNLIATAFCFFQGAGLLFIVGALLVRVGQQVVGLRMRPLRGLAQRSGVRGDCVPHQEFHPAL